MTIVRDLLPALSPPLSSNLINMKIYISQLETLGSAWLKVLQIHESK